MTSRDIITSWIKDGEGYLDLETKGLEPGPLQTGLAVAVCTYRRPHSLGRFLLSLAAQKRQPEELVIVDASPNADTEGVVENFIAEQGKPICTKYVRVGDSLRGLTRQRNLAIKLVGVDLTCFFDDDIVLEPQTLGFLEQSMRPDESLIAAGCHITNEVMATPPRRWRLRKLLRFCSDNQSGFLNPVGMAVPQGLWPPFTGAREVEVVPGGATCWRTKVLRAVPFDECFVGYGQAEDLEYSLRTKPQGPKVLVGDARALHLHDPAGRLPSYQYGRQSGHGFGLIFRRYGNVNPTTILQFAAWQLLDVLMLTASGNFRQAMGRCVGLMEQLRKNN